MKPIYEFVNRIISRRYSFARVAGQPPQLLPTGQSIPVQQNHDQPPHNASYKQMGRDNISKPIQEAHTTTISYASILY